MARSAVQKRAPQDSASLKAANASPKAAGESFASMLEESFGSSGSLEGKVVKGTVVAIENDFVLIDVGLKSEGRVALREFALAGQAPELKAGDTVEVFLERMEDRNGEAMLSREKAKREESWAVLQQSFDKQQQVIGIIFGRVKGGFTVDLNGAQAFLPGSQVDIRPASGKILRTHPRPASAKTAKWMSRFPNVRRSLKVFMLPPCRFIIRWRRWVTRFRGRMTACKLGHPRKVFPACAMVLRAHCNSTTARCASSPNTWAAASARSLAPAWKACLRRNFPKQRKRPFA